MRQHVCPWWLAYTFDNPLRALFHKPERIFAPYVRPGMTVADIGCGLGYFAIGLARLARGGKVLALDIQQNMLRRAEKRAIQSGVEDMIEFHLCSATDIKISEPLDFALAFWMVHESPDIPAFFRQVHHTLKPGGVLFVAEPRLHVSLSQFHEEAAAAELTGLRKILAPDVRFSRTAVFVK